MPTVRRWLTLFLVVFLPLQLATASVAAYCLHETGPSVDHIGHHQDANKAASADAAADTNDGDNPAGKADVQCEYCHFACAQTLVAQLAAWTPVSSSVPIDTLPIAFHSSDPSALDRPNWTASA